MMLTDYIRAAMRRATYEPLTPEDGGGFVATIPDCQGVWAHAAALEACRDELQSVLESWVYVKLRHGDADFAVIDGHDLNPQIGYVDPADAEPEPVNASLMTAAAPAYVTGAA